MPEQSKQNVNGCLAVTYLRGYDKSENILVREVDYCPWDDILILKLDDYTTLHASYFEKKEMGWVAGLPENY